MGRPPTILQPSSAKLICTARTLYAPPSSIAYHSPAKADSAAHHVRMSSSVAAEALAAAEEAVAGLCRESSIQGGSCGPRAASWARERGLRALGSGCG